MPEKVLLLSRKPLAARPLHTWLAESVPGLVLVAAPGAFDGLDPVWPSRFLAHHTVADYRSWATELTAEAAAREYGVGLVASASEDDVLRAARLRRRLGLPGQGEASALAYRDKLVMKQAVGGAGLGVPAHRAVDRPGDLLDFVAAVGLPVVVKPRREAASLGVRVLASPAEVTAFLAGGALPAAPRRTGWWMVEEFVHGDFFHVDGVTVGGAVPHCWPSRYSGGNAEAMAADAALTSVLLDADDPRVPVLREFAAAVHRALPAPPLPTSFHLEAWLTPAGRPVLCEVACRTGGGPIGETYARAFGAHPSRESLRGQCGLGLTADVRATPDRARGWALLPPGHGRFGPPPGPVPVRGVELTVRLAAGEVAAGVEYVGHAAATALVSGASAQEVAGRLDDLAAWWAGECGWD